MEAMLGLRDGALIPAVTSDGIAGPATAAAGGGVSAFGVDTNLNVRGATLFANPSTEEMLGLAGRDETDGVMERNDLVGVSSFCAEVSSGNSIRWLTAAVMSILPGAFRFIESSFLLESTLAFSLNWL